MRKLGYLTPRYIANRIRLQIYMRRKQDKPWLTPLANALLPDLLRPTDRGIEWGSGGSTAWFAERVQQLTSVEDDPQWYQLLTDKLRGKGGQCGLQVASVNVRRKSRRLAIRENRRFVRG